MEIEQILKKLEWLDEERRKDKTSIQTLRQQLTTLESNLPSIQDSLNGLGTEISRLASMTGKFDQMDSGLAQLRVEFARNLENMEKIHTERERDWEKVRRGDLDSSNKAIAEVRKGLESVPEVKRGLQTRTEEDNRLSKLIEELNTAFTENQRVDEEYRRTQHIMDETRRQDSKRVVDMQTETAAMRKKLEEYRGKVDLLADTNRKLEVRLLEIQNGENDRRQNQAAFIDKQNLSQVDRDRAWKDMQTRFEQINNQSLTLETTLQSLDSTQRAIKRSQETLDDATNRFDRRVNELTEMQRLTEDRFRQEWTSFKADDQKRWANYSLVQEEQLQETNRQFSKHDERLSRLESLTQEMRDLLHEITEEEQRRIQTILANYNEFLEIQAKFTNRPR
jgi:uncharacterized phage infection (PIP) family protein YhgE